MKSFLEILINENPRRSNGLYSITEIDQAFNKYIKQQLLYRMDIIERRPRKLTFLLNDKNHRWYNQEVKSTLKKNPHGLVRIYKDNKNEYIHVKFLIPI